MPLGQHSPEQGHCFRPKVSVIADQFAHAFDNSAHDGKHLLRTLLCLFAQLRIRILCAEPFNRHPEYANCVGKEVRTKVRQRGVREGQQVDVYASNHIALSH
eukprot:scaffold318_cov396-Prasinococcus_capsulatus_cf.AAC.2